MSREECWCDSVYGCIDCSPYIKLESSMVQNPTFEHLDELIINAEESRVKELRSAITSIHKDINSYNDKIRELRSFLQFVTNEYIELKKKLESKE